MGMRKRIRKLLLVGAIALFMSIFLQFSIIQKDYNEPTKHAKKLLPPYLKGYTSWYDSVLNKLSIEEKIGQMMMVPAYPNKGEADKKRVTELIKSQKVGGIIFFQGSPQDVHELIQYYQSISEVPLLIAIDGEWGLRMRLENTIKYPKQLTLGAITSEMLIYRMGKDIAHQLKHLGIHINFAPVADINNNPNNPVINSRSFGENRVNVARKSLLYMKGMQDEGVMAFAKHFPGHGDTDVDSHLGLPIINHSVRRLDSLELYPFKALINGGVGGVMMAHMHIPALDSTPNLPSTLSPKIATDLLQKKLSFKGLVVTDAMNMKGVADYFSPVEANLLAVKAGNDILLMPHDVGESIEAIKKEIKNDSSLEAKINKSLIKILKAKEWVIKNEVKEDFSIDSLFKPEYIYHRDQLLESAVTVIKNNNDLLPLRSLDTLKIAAVSFGDSPKAKYLETLRLYDKIDYYPVAQDITEAEEERLLTKLSEYNLVLVSMHSNSLNVKTKFGFSKSDIRLADKIIDRYKGIMVGLANPYTLSWLPNLNKAQAIILCYENSSEAQHYTAQSIFGASSATGRLPVTISDKFERGAGQNVYSIKRLKYVTPFEAGFDKKKLEIIDSIVADAISQKAIPGCQILAAKKGEVFFYKAYGYHTYNKREEVSLFNLYDIASVTKIAATVPTIMRLQQEKKLDIFSPLKTYLPSYDTNAKGDLLLTDILLHQAGLTSWIPFYWSTLEPIYPGEKLYANKQTDTYSIKIGPYTYANRHIRYKKGYFSSEPSDSFNVQVAEGLYMNHKLVDSMWKEIATSKLEEPGNYKYSDLGFYLLFNVAEHITKIPFEKYTDSVFYSKLGAYTLGFNPLKRFPKEDIIPTENDLVFRQQLVQGYVHDPGAAMMGGVSGHAGLFCNANDLAKLMQMYLNGGKYAGDYYLSRKLMKEYTSCPNCEGDNRRGYGFDKPQADTTRPGPAFKGISPESFGHMGFTGTMTWVDPDTDIVYVFLSNRVFPDAVDNKLARMDIRTNIQKAIYKAQL